MHRTLSMIALAAILTGCSMATLPAAPDRTFTIDASFDDTWAALVAHVSGEAWPIGTLEKDSGLLTVNDTTLPYSRDVFACAITKTEGVSEIQLRMSFVVTSTGDDTSRLTINLNTQGRAEDGIVAALTGDRIDRWAECESHGVLEQNIIDGITQNLNS